MLEKDLVALKKDLTQFSNEYGHRQEDDMRRAIKKVIDRLAFYIDTEG